MVGILSNDEIHSLSERKDARLEKTHMEFHEVILKRRSVRRFKEDSVPRSILHRILEAGRWAPSGANLQPWKFIVITKPEGKARIAETCTEHSKTVWKGFAPATARFLANRGGSWNKTGMKTVPLLVAICYTVTDEPTRDTAFASTWTAIENILLAVTNENLAACVYTHASQKEESDLKRILAVPDNYNMAAVIQLGYPNVIPEPPPRRSLEEIVSYEHF